MICRLIAKPIYHEYDSTDNGQPWSIEFKTCRIVLTHEGKVKKHEAKLSVSNIFLSVSKHF